MTTIQQAIATKMTQQALCSTCKYRDSCDRTPIQNAWRFENTQCPKWSKWNHEN